MENKARRKMTPGERAKQFMPFSALKGLDDALREKEKVVVPKPQLSEDAAEIIDRTLRQIEPFSVVSIIYYSGGEYIKIKGVLTKIDKQARKIQIVDTPVNIDDILELTI